MAVRAVRIYGDPVLRKRAREVAEFDESLLRLVIRSNVTQASPGALTVSITPPDQFAAETLAARPELGLVWRGDSQRHLAPPKTSPPLSD